MPIEIKGLEELKKKLSKLSQVVSPAQMKKSMNTVGNMMQNVVEESFETQSDPWGKKWEELKEPTKKAKSRKHKSNNILRREGDLADKWKVEADASSVTLSGNAKSDKGYAYGTVHQWGSSKDSGRGSGIEARPFLPVDEDGVLEEKLEKNIQKVIHNKLLKALED